MPLTEYDRNLLARCLGKKPRAWEDFVDRYTGLVVHVVNHSAQCRSLRITQEDREDLVAEVFLEVVKDEFALLRLFRGESSLSTYLTVVARRIVVHQLMQRKTLARLADAPTENAINHHEEERVHDQDEVERLLGELEGAEATVVRMYHLEGKSYSEISSAVGMPENSVGPTLSRAREKMRQASAKS